MKKVVKHIVKEGSREHVVSRDSYGSKCFELNCEINFRREERIKNEHKINEIIETLNSVVEKLNNK